MHGTPLMVGIHADGKPVQESLPSQFSTFDNWIHNIEKIILVGSNGHAERRLRRQDECPISSLGAGEISRWYLSLEWGYGKEGAK
jgi:hypothetical protein